LIPIRDANKVKLSLYLTKYYAMKAYGGSVCTDPHVLGLVGGEWSSSRFCTFTSGKQPTVLFALEARWVTQPVWALQFDSRYGQECSHLHIVQIGSGVYPPSYPTGTGRLFPGGKEGGA
jgi:hypothetical protein